MNQIFSYALVVIFAVLLPFQEWPDVNEHWVRNDYYVHLIKLIQELAGILEPRFIYSSEHENFFSGLWTEEKFRDYKLNYIKIPFVVAILFLINKISIRSKDEVLIFSPPFIFSLMTISNEPFAIFLITISYLLVYQRKILLPITVGFIATIVDRSMVANYFSICILVLYLRVPTKFFIYFICFISFIFLFFGLDVFKLLFDNWSFYGLSNQDITFNNEFGKRNLLALLATISGLYGWISIHPEPWFIYYFLVIFLFSFGLFICNIHEKLEFFIFICPVFIILAIIPTLSQARYYPILTLLFWRLTWIGFKFFLNSKLLFCSLFTLMTLCGLVISHL